MREELPIGAASAGARSFQKHTFKLLFEEFGAAFTTSHYQKVIDGMREDARLVVGNHGKRKHNISAFAESLCDSLMDEGIYLDTSSEGGSSVEEISEESSVTTGRDMTVPEITGVAINGWLKVPYASRFAPNLKFAKEIEANSDTVDWGSSYAPLFKLHEDKYFGRMLLLATVNGVDKEDDDFSVQFDVNGLTNQDAKKFMLRNVKGRDLWLMYTPRIRDVQYRQLTAIYVRAFSLKHTLGIEYFTLVNGDPREHSYLALKAGKLVSSDAEEYQRILGKSKK